MHIYIRGSRRDLHANERDVGVADEEPKHHVIPEGIEGLVVPWLPGLVVEVFLAHLECNECRCDSKNTSWHEQGVTGSRYYL